MESCGPKGSYTFRMSTALKRGIAEIAREDGLSQEQVIAAGLAIYAIRSGRDEFANRFFGSGRV